MVSPEIITLGPDGTNSAQAARLYAPEADLAFGRSIQSVLGRVARGHYRAGIVPLRNTIKGVVNETFDNLYANGLSVTGAVWLDIEHVLCGLDEQIDPAEVTSVASHWQALGQCRRYLAEHYPDADLEEVSSTAAAMQQIRREKDGHTLAIGSEAAAALYGLQIVARNIGDRKDNRTQFVVVSAEPVETMHVELDFILVAAPATRSKDRPGLMSKIIGMADNAGVDLRHAESRPNPLTTFGDNVFYMLMELTSSDNRYQSVADNITELTGQPVARLSR